MGHIIAVVGGKGGVGKSVFAANLAIAYQMNFKQRSLIIDLDFQSLGDQNIILGLNPPKNIVDVTKAQVGTWDPKAMTPFLPILLKGSVSSERRGKPLLHGISISTDWVSS